MKFLFPKLSLRRPGKLSRRDTRIFAEASELARLRLEQCIADRYIAMPATYEKLTLGWTSLSSAHPRETDLSNTSAEAHPVYLQR